KRLKTPDGDNADIVLVEHRRASDDRPAPPMYLRRDPASGVLRWYSPEFRGPDEFVNEIVGEDCKLCAWASGPFTKTEFVAKREEIVGAEVPRRKVESVFTIWVRDRIVIPATDASGEPLKRNGHLLYSLSDKCLEEPEETTSAPRVPRRSGGHAKSSGAHG